MSSSASNEIYDLVGLGFGPANLAIAVALIDKWALNPISTDASLAVDTKKVIFLEKFESFKWHPGMLLPDARMQISFLKDLATLRTPQSQFTFLAYLHSQNRLIKFINRGYTVPTRKEYADYLSWAADVVQTKGVEVRFGTEVVGFEENPSGTITVRSRDVITGIETTREAKNIVISPGGSPLVPSLGSTILEHPLATHTSQYLTSISRIVDTLKGSQTQPLRVAIVGSGQSACEVCLDLRERLAASAGNENRIDLIVRKGALRPSNDSPFSNEIFDPASTNDWFSLSSQHARESRLREYKSTNYGVVSARIIDQLYEVIYDQTVDEDIAKRTGAQNGRNNALIKIRPYTHLLSAQLSSERANLEANPAEQRMFDVLLQNTTTREVVEESYDALILATGYQRLSWIPLLKNSAIGKHFGLDPQTSEVVLTPASKVPMLDMRSQERIDLAFAASTSEYSSSPRSSTSSTPPTSEFSSTVIDPHTPTRVYISRQYRLVPVSTETTLKARIYLQGVEEATHGLSDTLLSVISVRGGEVVDDLYRED